MGGKEETENEVELDAAEMRMCGVINVGRIRSEIMRVTTKVG